MTGRIKIIRKTTSVVDGRRQQEEKEFFSCWCDVKSLGTNEKYNALQIGLENTIMFETRACDKMEEIRLNLKEFYAVYKGVLCEFCDVKISTTACSAPDNLLFCLANLCYGDCYSDTDEARFGKWVARVTGFIISIPAALMWWGTPLIVGGLILYDTIQEKNPELCGFTAEEFDKEENK